ncbi:MAG: N-acetylglucosamine kinase [Propioniciclava sp.]
MLAIGVDVGGTKTHVSTLRDIDLADRVFPTAEWWPAGSPLEAPAQVEALVAMLQVPADAGADAGLVIGAHGIDSMRVCAQVETLLRERFPGRVRVFNDAALVGPAAGFRGPVISVIAGTGSITVSGHAERGYRSLGGHGYLLGDEGSAPALTRDVVRAVLRAADQGSPDRIAVDVLGRAAGVPADALEPEQELAVHLHLHAAITDWGRLGPAVFTAAHQGSPAAREVIAAHAGELVELVRRHLALEPATEAVVLAGGVVAAQPTFAEALQAGIGGFAPSLPVVVLRKPPVAGALVLARDLTTNSRLLSAGGSTPGEQPTAQ